MTMITLRGLMSEEWWDSLSGEEQTAYLKKHPKTKRKKTASSTSKDNTADFHAQDTWKSKPPKKFKKNYPSQRADLEA